MKDQEEKRLRKCSICKNEKELTDEFFHHSKHLKSQYRSECKICRNKKLKEKRLKSREENENENEERKQ